ncbi:MAG: Methyltransferase type 11 [Geminicoccaceae bacterium]|nr:Methyltransferase type 11 [Geminicoccaceae bacterium]
MSDAPVMERWTLDVLRQCGRAEISPAVALIRLLAGGNDPGDLEATLGQHGPDAGRAELEAGAQRVRAVLEDHPACRATVAELLRRDRDDQLAGNALEHWRQWFDGAVRASPEASVALYSLGDAALLDRATAEVVGLLEQLGVLAPEREVLDVGCGIGRFVQALAPQVAAVVGIDIAPGMIAAAQQSCAGPSNVRLLLTSGRDLAGFGCASFDLVLAVDTVPYLYRTDPCLVETHLLETARVLRPGGDLVILNLSYRGDLDQDRRDAAGLAEQAGLVILRNGTSDLRLWDGRTFHLRRPV